MSFYTLCIIALGLSMDAFAVFISKGVALRSFCWKQALYISLCFGFFQGIMPVIGFFVGLQFSSMIQNWDHWIGFVLLALIGINMVREGLNSDSEESVEPSINLKRLLTLFSYECGCLSNWHIFRFSFGRYFFCYGNYCTDYFYRFIIRRKERSFSWAKI